MADHSLCGWVCCRAMFQEEVWSACKEPYFTGYATQKHSADTWLPLFKTKILLNLHLTKQNVSKGNQVHSLTCTLAESFHIIFLFTEKCQLSSLSSFHWGLNTWNNHVRNHGECDTPTSSCRKLVFLWNVLWYRSSYYEKKCECKRGFKCFKVSLECHGCLPLNEPFALTILYLEKQLLLNLNSNYFTFCQIIVVWHRFLWIVHSGIAM